MYQTFSAPPGSIWKMGAWSLTTCVESPIYGSNDNFVVAKIVFLDTGVGEIGSSEAVICDNSAPLGTWTYHELTGDAPAEMDSVRAYILFISPTLQGGAVWVDDISLAQTGTTGVGTTPPVGGFTLHQNVPNPFNPTTRIDFDLAKEGALDLSVYDVTGSLVATLFQGRLEAGPHNVTWNGMTAEGTKAASGIYVCVLASETGQTSRLMVLLR
jgi:hypothetical protein